MTRCRTILRRTELVYVAAPCVGAVVGAALAVVGLVGQQPFALVVSAVFFATAAHELRRTARTATELALDDSGLHWWSTWRSGVVAPDSILRITRTAQPGVYAFECLDQVTVPFWLSTRDEDVQRLFGTLLATQPQILSADLYRRGRLWWRGLPPPGAANTQ